LIRVARGIVGLNHPLASARGSAFVLVGYLMTLAFPAQTQQPAKEAPHATLAGTVFRDPGFAQPGAVVVVSLKSDPEKKLQEAVTDRRGEFLFRVAPGPAAYLLTATLKGFKRDRQDFDVSGEERINATLLLVPESKK
jgi:hypothetical protein